MARLNGDKLFEGVEWRITPCEPCLVRKNIFQGSVIHRKREREIIGSAVQLMLFCCINDLFCIEFRDGLMGFYNHKCCD